MLTHLANGLCTDHSVCVVHPRREIFKAFSFREVAFVAILDFFSTIAHPANFSPIFPESLSRRFKREKKLKIRILRRTECTLLLDAFPIVIGIKGRLFIRPHNYVALLHPESGQDVATSFQYEKYNLL